MPAVWMLHLAEDTTGIEDAFSRIEAGQRARGALAIGLSTTLASRAICHVRSGALLDAQADAELALQAAPTESFAPLRNIATAALARVDAERGFPQPALALIDAQLARDSGCGAEQLTLQLERAQVLRALRRPREAANVAREVGVEAQAVGFEGATMLLWPAVAAEALLELGDAEHAAHLAARGVELAQRFGAPGPIGCALRVRGIAERNLEVLQAAEHSLAGSSMRLEHARSLVELGAALRRDGQRRQHESRSPREWNSRTAALPTRSSRAPTRSSAPPAPGRARSCAVASMRSRQASYGRRGWPPTD